MQLGNTKCEKCELLADNTYCSCGLCADCCNTICIDEQCPCSDEIEEQVVLIGKGADFS